MNTYFVVVNVLKRFRNGHNENDLLIEIDKGLDEAEHIEEMVISWAENSFGGTTTGYKVSWRPLDDKTKLIELLNEEILDCIETASSATIKAEYIANYINKLTQDRL